MSAMEDMLAKMLQKALPPELMALLTPANIEEFGNNIAAFAAEIRERLSNIEAKQERQRATLEELLDHVGRKDSSRRRGSASGRNSGSGSVGDGGGSD
jgi:hypothetical protein